MRALLRVLGWFGWAALGLVAALGVALSSVALLALLPVTRPVVASAIVKIADEAIPGRLKLEAVEVLSRGGVEIRGLEVFDPEDRLVLSVGRAAVFADVTGIAARTVGVTLELDAPSVLLEEDPDGTPSLVRAFVPPAAPGGAPAEAKDRPGPGWTVHLSRITVRGGDVWWVDAARRTRFQAQELDLDARGLLGPGRARAELRLAGRIADPIDAPVRVEVSAYSTGNAAFLPVLRASLGGTSLAAVAEGDLARRSGRLAVTRLGIDRQEIRSIAPEAPAGEDLRAVAYAESDGFLASAALRAEPVAKGAPGRMDAAAAARLAEPAAAVGLDVALDRVDPARLVSWAPPGDVNLTARGAVAGSTVADLRGRVTAELRRSRIRRGAIDAAELRARADRGFWVVERAKASASGASLDGSIRWRKGGEVSGSVALDARDLSAAVRNLGWLLGEAFPPASGRARLEATLAGTEDRPVARFSLSAPAVGYGGLTVTGARLAGEATGPFAAPSGRLEGRVAKVRSDGAEVATEIALTASLSDEVAAVSATTFLPRFRDPATIEAAGRLGAGRETFTVSRLALDYPGSRWTLEVPATVLLSGPTVDRLALSAGAQRISIAGGIGSGNRLDARVEVERLDLARLPAGFAPEEGLRGELSASVRATGEPERPEVDATFGVTGASFRELEGVSAEGRAAWSVPARRGSASVTASVAGGTIDVRADLPFPIEGRPKEPVRLATKVDAVRVGELLAVAGGEATVEGLLSAEATLEGAAGAPRFRGEARLHDAEIEEIEALSLAVELEEPGNRLLASASAAREGSPFLVASAEVPLDLAELLARPAEAMAGLRRAPLLASATLAGLDLSGLAGRAGLPEGIEGMLEGDVALEGSLEAPRGRAELELARGTVAGYRDLAARATGVLDAGAVALTGWLKVAGEEALRVEASLGAPVERLDSPEAIGAVPLRVRAEIPRFALARVTADAPYAGTIEGTLTAGGTPSAPTFDLALSGEEVAVEKRRLGDFRLEARYESASLAARARFRSATGGDLRATLGVEADLGLGAAPVPLAEAPAEATAMAEDLDLGFLPAIAPGVVRAGAGKLAVDVRARGPLSRMSPRGTVVLRDGRLSVSEFGDFTGIAVEVRVTDDAVEVPRVVVHRGKGKVTATGSLRGLLEDRGRLEAKLEAADFTVTRAGSDFATFDLQVNATGKQEGKVLSVEANVPRGLVRLPRKTPRTLQSLERREDIVVGRREARRRAAPKVVVLGPPEEPYRVSARLVVPRGFFVKGIDPEVDIELKADVRYDLIKKVGYAEGLVEVVRGQFEPIGGRKFVVERGRVQFTGGPPEQALLDFQARYDNPNAVVTVNVQGPATAPEIRLSSQPPMDDGQIAMLIATGRTELKAGSGGVGTLTGEEAGRAALGALATQAFRNLVADKLPLDTVALESSAIRAGKYLTDKIYVAYTRHFEADPEKGENVDEVRVEYQITPRWTFESVYGSAQAGAASLIWSKDY